jgi:hypothetical protein
VKARARSRRQSLWGVFAAPLGIALLSVIGLVAALTGDGMRDAVAWIGLGVPVAVTLWAMRHRRS